MAFQFTTYDNKLHRSDSLTSEPSGMDVADYSDGAGNKRFACDVCDAQFTMIGNLNRHKKGHSNHRPYTCNFCLRGFLRRTSYIEHIRLHTGEKPYTCEICYQTFVRKKCHQMHIRKCKEENKVEQTNNTARQLFDNNLKLKHKLQEASLSHQQNRNQSEDAEGPLDLSSKQTLSPNICNSNLSKLFEASLFYRTHFYTMAVETGEPLNMSTRQADETSVRCSSQSPVSSTRSDSFSECYISTGTEPLSISQTKEQPLEADNTMASPKPLLQEQIQIDGKPLFNCKFCSIYFTSFSVFRKHTSLHDETNPMICTICSKLCDSVEDFLMHH